MTYVLSVIADPANPAIDPSLLDRLTEAVKGSTARMLADGVAYDIGLAEAPEAEALKEAIAVAKEAGGVDINLIPGDTRRKKLLIADMDSTMIEQECIEIGEHHLDPFGWCADEEVY